MPRTAVERNLLVVGTGEVLGKRLPLKTGGGGFSEPSGSAPRFNTIRHALGHDPSSGLGQLLTIDNKEKARRPEAVRPTAASASRPSGPIPSKAVSLSVFTSLD